MISDIEGRKGHITDDEIIHVVVTTSVNKQIVFLSQLQ
jgi:hypothetical protein